MASRRCSWGFSLLELAVVAAVVAVLGAALISALGRYQGQMEREAVDIAIRQMQTGLRLQVLDAQFHGKRREIAAFPGSNPITLRGAPPADYRGAFAESPDSSLRGWYFDLCNGQLVYRPNSYAFTYNPGEDGELRWHLEAVAGSEMAVKLVSVAPSGRDMPLKTCANSPTGAKEPG